LIFATGTMRDPFGLPGNVSASNSSIPRIQIREISRSVASSNFWAS